MEHGRRRCVLTGLCRRRDLTNITGQFFAGYDAFLKQHEVIFAGRAAWKVIAYHNVDVKPGIPVPEPR